MTKKKKKAKRKPEKNKVSAKMKLVGKKMSKKPPKKKKTAAKKSQKQKISTKMKLNTIKSTKKIAKKKKTVKKKSEKKNTSTKIKSVKKKLALKNPKKKKALKSKVKSKKIIKKVIKKRKPLQKTAVKNKIPTKKIEKNKNHERKLTAKSKAAKEYEEVYKILLIQRGDLLKLISKSSSREQNISELEHGNVEDMAASSLEREMTFAMGSREREEFFMLNNAMKKIANGVYGKCESCGKKINIKRLKIVPFSQYCMECKSNMESGIR